MTNRPLPKLPLDRILVAASIVLGTLHAWVGRYAMNPDGMSYLDVRTSFFRRDWTNAINAWWSPLYPWLLGLLLASRSHLLDSEFPLVHLVNFGIFVLSLFAFRFLLHGLLRFLREQGSEVRPQETEPLPDSFFILL
jgi:hypothetical protein